MRPIKFKAWDKRNKQMSGVFSLTELTLYEHIFEVKFKKLARFKDLVWLEYTGLKDKNGKEIYEGDLFYFSKYSTLPAEIYWDDRFNGWRGRVKGEMQPDKTYDISGLKFGEVIGNIYENPIGD